MHRFAIGFGGTKGNLFNRAKNALEEMSPIRGRIDGNAIRGRIFVPGQVPMSDEMLVVDYIVREGIVDVLIRNTLPVFVADQVRAKMDELSPTGPYHPVKNELIPSSIPIEKLPDLSTTVGKKQRQESKQLSVIDDDKPMLSKKVMTALAIVTAIGFGMYFVLDKKEAPGVAAQE